jgi:AGZA family xanthine/uracil permease-like MFS transporter
LRYWTIFFWKQIFRHEDRTFPKMTLSERLDRYFLLSERQTDVVTEIRAGTASFLTLSYLLLVNPKIMSSAGVSHQDAVFATALSAALSCFIVGLLGNLPFGCAPGLGLSAYLTFGLVQAGLCSLQDALSACWWSGIFVAVVNFTGLSALLMKVVPTCIKLGIVVGMGLLIAMIGMVSVGASNIVSSSCLLDHILSHRLASFSSQV